MKTIAIIESCDTKGREALFMRGIIEEAGIRPLVIDVATGPDDSAGYDVSRNTVTAFAGRPWEQLEGLTKGEKIAFMQSAAAGYVRALYDRGEVDGVVSVGGLQNTVMATEVMKALPIGVPKVMATTVACGQKTFEPVVGKRDIVVIPSICDFTGLNMITSQIIRNACACCIGMVQQKGAGKAIRKGNRPVVGVTLMGITNTGACSAIDELERLGIEAVGFHATGTGGNIMEEMAVSSLLDGVLDLTTHEIAEGYFGRGFSYSPDWKKRITRVIDRNIPLVVCPGGLDFCDFYVSEFPPRMDERAYMMHNGDIAHIKLLPEEARVVADDFASRISRAAYPVKVLLPTEGMRHNTRPGEELYRPEVDKLILDRIRAIDNPFVELVTIEGNLDTKEWGIQAARQMAKAVIQTCANRLDMI